MTFPRSKKYHSPYSLDSDRSSSFHRSMALFTSGWLLASFPFYCIFILEGRSNSKTWLARHHCDDFPFFTISEPGMFSHLSCAISQQKPWTKSTLSASQTSTQLSSSVTGQLTQIMSTKLGSMLHIAQLKSEAATKLHMRFTVQNLIIILLMHTTNNLSLPHF
jgi:hypothetical protein